MNRVSPPQAFFTTGIHNEAWIISTPWNIGPALHLSVLGLLLILFFLSRLGLRIAVLPLSLEKHKDRDSDEGAHGNESVGITVLAFAAGVSVLAAYRGERSSGVATCNHGSFGALVLSGGIFLLGLVWRAFHFLGDFHRTTEDYQVAIEFVSRLCSCLAMSYVFEWLTLRSGSIWPAALCEGPQNVWALST
jgi:hypothetical protein